MRNFLGKIFIILLIIGLAQNLLYADNMEESEDGFKHPEGLDAVKISSLTREHLRHSRNPDKFWLNADNLKEFTDIRKWMEDAGLAFNDKNLGNITRGIHKCVNKMWSDAISKLMNCDAFKNHNNGDTKKKFLEGIKEDPIPIRFIKGRSDFQGDTKAAIDEYNHMLIHFYDLENIVKYYSKKMLKGETNIDDFNDEIQNKNFHELTGFVGHEMLHAFAGMASISIGKESPAQIRNECEVHCLQKKCLDKNHTYMPQGCDGQGRDMFCDYNNTCEFTTCTTKPPPSTGGSSSSSGSSRHSDKPDDNYSYSSAIYSLNSVLLSIAFPININQEFLNVNYYPDILVYNKFNYPDLPQLLDDYTGFSFINDYVHDHFSTNHKVLIIPSGEFMGDENSLIIKEALKQFVAAGGTLLVLSQQYDTHFENLVPVPENETLKTYGWRQDQSCYHGSVYFDTVHPIISSSPSEQLTVAVDGYFSQWPSTATVVLNRTKNREAALLYYPYGENGGHVILTSLYTDWGHSHSQATKAELDVVRDLITFAKNPTLPIPMYNLENNPTPQILLDVGIKNNTEAFASKAKLIASSPDRKTVLYEIEQSVALSPGEETEIPLTFTLPQLESKDYGICHVDFYLFDAENNLIQLPTESDSGRFSIYNITEQYTPSGGIDAWLTVEDEEIFLYEVPKFTLHVKNYTDTDQTIAFEYECNHRGKQPLFSLTVPAGQKVEQPINMEHEEPFLRFRVYYYDLANNLREISKGLFLLSSSTKSSLTLHNQGYLQPAAPLEFTIESIHLAEQPLPGAYPIRVALERYNRREGFYEEVATVYETTHDFSLDKTFHYQGTYVPGSSFPTGSFRLKLEIGDTEGLREYNRYQDFYYLQSAFAVEVSSLRLAQNGQRAYGLSPGGSYTIPVKAKNYSGYSYNVKEGSVLLVLESESGQEAFRKEITGIALSVGEEKELLETFTFTPAELGRYYLRYKYWDETMTEPVYFRTAQEPHYGTRLYFQQDKPNYDYLDTANISVKIAGMGNNTLHFTCAGAGIDETRQVQIPEGSFTITEVFQLPIGIASNYDVVVSIEDESGGKRSRSLKLYRNSLRLDYRGNFIETFARSGSDLHLDMNLRGITGMSHPVSGELSVICPQLNVEDVKTVTLQPLVDNPFSYTIPIGDVPVGIYAVDVSFKTGELEHITKRHSIILPEAKLEFSLPGNNSNFNAGEPLTLNMQNTGGKAGNFQVEILLKDSLNTIALEHKETRNIEAGGIESLTITLPSSLKSDKYLLVQKSKDTATQKQTTQFSPVTVSGVTASLNSYTLKEAYFHDESISGKAEIGNGAGDIQAGTLKAKIIRYRESKGTEEEKPGEFIPYNLIEEGCSSGTTLYLSTDKGILEYNTVSPSGSVPVIYNLDYNCRKMLVTSGGELWLGTSGGLFRRDSQGQWHHYTTSDGLLSNWPYDLLEGDFSGHASLWVATMYGISVFDFSSAGWTSLTTENGLPSDRTYALAKDGSGAVWASTYNGLARYNGTTFETAAAPSGSINIYDREDKLTAAADGSIWLAFIDKLCRFHGGAWEEFPLSDIYPGYSSSLSLQAIETVNGELWANGRARDLNGNYFNVLIRFDNGNFTVYDEKEIPGFKGLDYKPIIPGSGTSASAYFTCEVGYMEYDGDTGEWKHHMLDIDSHKLAGQVYCLAKDSNGRLWAGTQYGISGYDGNQWTNYYSLAGNELALDVKLLDIDSLDRVYGYYLYMGARGGILRLSDGQYEPVLFPGEFRPEYSDKMLVDRRGRIWVGRRKMYYYDNDGQWHLYPGITYTQSMVKDSSGGIWAGCRDSSAQFHLKYVNRDLVVTADYTASNSDMLPWDKNRLYMDEDGILWLTGYAYNWNDVRSLESFDGTHWVNYTGYDGFPRYGVSNLVKDESGRVVVIDEKAGELYYLENGADAFVLLRDNVFNNNSLVLSNGQLHCAGLLRTYHDYTYGSDLLKIGTTSGLVEEELWSRVYEIILQSGENKTLDMETGKSFESGSYVLKTALLSSLGQELAAGHYAFKIRDTGVSAVLSAGNLVNGYWKAGTELPVSLEVFNNTSAPLAGLNLIVKKESPGGDVFEMIDESLTLSAGQLATYSLAFSETTPGTWKIAGVLSDASGVLSEATMVVQIEEPLVSMEITAPEYAGDEPVELTVRLINEGNINTELNALAKTGGNDLIDETFTSAPKAEQIFSFSDTLTADKTYTFTLSGDVSKSETISVKYGYVENFTLNVLPSYREGSVTIDYAIANGGGLAFSDNLHVELFSVGSSAPLYTVDRNYNLYPGEPPITDTVVFNLVPGNYQLKYKTGKNPFEQSSLFTVQPSGIGTVSFNGSTYPIGIDELSYSIINTDTAAGQIPVTISLNNDTETRTYYLEPGETQTDSVQYEFTQPGNYTLTFTGSKLAVPVNAVVQVLKGEEVSANLTIGTPEAGNIPVVVDIANSGYNDFSGTLVMEVDGMGYEEVINVSGASSVNLSFPFETAVLNPGTKEVKVFLYDLAGTIVSQAANTIAVNPADIQLVDFPGNLEIDAGGYAGVPLTFGNEGNLRGEAVLKIDAFDTLFLEREIALEPGREIQLDDIFIDVPADLPSGNYPFNYTLKGSGVESGALSGNFNFKVNGITLDVDASLDHSLYNVGETAVLTLTLNSSTPTDAPLEAVVNWGNFSERRPFTLNTSSLVFNIPLDEKREEKVFYGIYHQGGKGIHLNDIYLHFKDVISVETDKQVYEPGETIQAVFTGDQTGTLTVEAFAESYTLNLSGSVSVTFTVPDDTLGGTYGINWSFMPSATRGALFEKTAPLDPPQKLLTGSFEGIHFFDVSGLVVKVAKAGLEKGKYAPGETIHADYIFESNRDETLELRCWVTAPSGEWEYLGESSVTASAENHVNALSSYSFNTGEAGTHHLVYGLYKDDQLVVSGRLAFDVGDAVLLGISTDRFEYKQGNENVNVNVDYFGEGTAQLELFLDGEKVREHSLTLNGVGSTTISLSSGSVNGGSHSLEAVLTKDNLTSTKTTGFVYGTHLPDLAISLMESLHDGLDYTYKVEVTNSGKTGAAGTALTFSDNESPIATVSIPSLQPGDCHEQTFQWNGKGKAGTHTLAFEVDKNNIVKEFSENNNLIEISEEVPSLFYSLEVEPLIYPANTNITIITRLINNQAIPLQLTLDLSLTNDETGTIIFQRNQAEGLTAFGSKAVTDTFNTGVYLAGEHTLSQSVTGDNVDKQQELSILIEATKTMSASLQLLPLKIPADTDSEVELTMNLKNTGNVPLEDETVEIDVFNKDTETVVKTEDILVSLAIAEQKEEKKVLVLNLVEGNYEIRVKYLEEIIASGELTVIPPIKPEKIVDVHPRLLIMNLTSSPSSVSSVTSVANLFNDYEIEIAHGFEQSYLAFHKGYSNVNIIFGSMPGRKLRDELRERVRSGEGLIFICNNPLNAPDLTEWIGVNVRPISGKDRERVVQLPENEFTIGGEVELMETCRLMVSKEKEDVLTLAHTQQKKYPVICYRRYGKGHIMVITFPFEFKSGGEHMAQLLVNAVNAFSKDIYTLSLLTRLIPVEISLKNEGGEEKSIIVKELLPYGVEGFDYEPEPQEAQEVEELKWPLTVPAASTMTISYWLKLPDQVNTFDIKTELYDSDGETKLEEVSLTFEVSQTVLSRLDELILELETLEVSGKDAQWVRKAGQRLEQIRNRPGETTVQLVENLLDAVQAAYSLGEVKETDVSVQRLKTRDIMIVMGRSLYEKIETEGLQTLQPFLNMIKD